MNAKRAALSSASAGHSAEARVAAYAPQPIGETPRLFVQKITKRYACLR